MNNLNELTSNANSGTLTVVGTTTSAATNVTVHGSSAARYGDATFAAPNIPLTNSYTAIASDGLGRHATNTVTVSIATNTTFQYDGNGNLTSDGLRSFAYDDENQLIQVLVTNQWKSQFTYDGKMRRRIRQEFTWQNGAWVQTNAVYYVYDGNVVIQERDINNLPTTTYTRGLDLSGSLQGAGGIAGLLARTSQAYGAAPLAGQAYYHSDVNGNVTMLINDSQAIVAKYLYDAFGNIIAKSGLLADANLYRFSNKEAHPNSGLIYYLYRYYDPNLQRWPNRGPINELAFNLLIQQHEGFNRKQEQNLCGFVGNNAVNNGDLLGFDNPGCDPPGDQPGNKCPAKKDCYLRCCAEHDKCYYDNGCSAWSWIIESSPECMACNAAAATCVAVGCNSPNPPKVPRWFCPNGPNAGKFYDDYSKIPASCWKNGKKPANP